LPSEPSAATALGFGEDHDAFPDFVARQFLDHIVRGGRFLEDLDLATDDVAGAESGHEVVGMQTIGRRAQLVALVRTRFDVVAGLAEFLDA
jgi:hypothetical protein